MKKLLYMHISINLLKMSIAKLDKVLKEEKIINKKFKIIVL